MLRLMSANSRAPRNAFQRAFRATILVASHQPNTPLDLDPSFLELMKDVDLSVRRHKQHSAAGLNSLPHRELEVVHESWLQDDYLTAEELDSQNELPDGESQRKSPAATFGSQRIGAVVLPLELQETISRLITDSDKPMLHVDAKRLFKSGEPTSTGGEQWDTSYDISYKSYTAARRHAERDGVAFASVALPAHYSAVAAVLEHLKHRMGFEWNVEHIVDWGAAAGSALWASLHALQKSSPVDTDGPRIANTSVSRYLGIDKRESLVKAGKRLLEGVDVGGVDISWRRSYYGIQEPALPAHGEVLAISAFLLSTLPTPLARKALVKDMWESGADTIVLIDHNTPDGFDIIAEARNFLLKQGRNEVENYGVTNAVKKGCHVVAPCPHDGACPLQHNGSKKILCGFSQRLQRPEFVRKTKHSGIGHEDIGYSYVVIRRGSRPSRVETKVGRIGAIGRREGEKFASRTPMAELVADPEDALESRDEPQTDRERSPSDTSVKGSLSPEELAAALRWEAYSWPRLVFPPLKKAGHIILDGCTREGKIMRMTIPKSQGKQPYYDARKSSWGDIFPHDPKNSPQERFSPKERPKRR